MWQRRNRQGRSKVKGYPQVCGKFKGSPDYMRPSLKYIYGEEKIMWQNTEKWDKRREYSDWKEKLMGDFRTKGIGDGL